MNKYRRLTLQDNQNAQENQTHRISEDENGGLPDFINVLPSSTSARKRKSPDYTLPENIELDDIRVVNIAKRLRVNNKYKYCKNNFDVG